MASKFLIEVGKNKSSYKVRYEFASSQQSRAFLHYSSLLTHSGHKKRLVRVHRDGSRTVIDRVLT